ncbi:MAG: beta-ketoacyl-[acyl-carrier-protein] synthase II [Bacteroidetes bacterium]|nr:MAG: beta-ketoacyl-[acyl-carrier-protein] synthase II [Bacteroidota bacterium]
MQGRRVVITGLGALTPVGNNVPQYWDALSNGVSGSDWITHFDTTHFKTKFACEVKNFDATAYFDRKNVRKLDPFVQYGIVAADEAMADAAFNLENEDLSRFGVIMGSGIGGIHVFAEEVTSFVEGGKIPRMNPFFITKMIIDIGAGQISIKYGLRGPNYSAVSACATSSNCIIDAFMLIKFGYADMMLAGGSEAPITEMGVGGFNAMKALSENNEEYKSASRPFDVRRDGFVIGEGAGCLVLEEYEHAVARGAKIYAEIAGIGLSADAHHITAPDPEGLGTTQVMRNALKDAEISAEDVDYINVHGTSTPLGDVSESNAIKRVFGEHAHKLNISSTKSMTGHLLGAAGAIEAIAGVLAIKNSLIPPTINFEQADPECDLNYTFNKAQERVVNVAISNTFGFGGHNTSIILKKPDFVSGK